MRRAAGWIATGVALVVTIGACSGKDEHEAVSVTEHTGVGAAALRPHDAERARAAGGGGAGSGSAGAYERDVAPPRATQTSGSVGHGNITQAARAVSGGAGTRGP